RDFSLMEHYGASSASAGDRPVPFSGIPPALRQNAANLARWFPEVLLALGAPDLE
ncbi:unnamed protein product, partial [Polarella glacialis]